MCALELIRAGPLFARVEKLLYLAGNNEYERLDLTGKAVGLYGGRGARWPSNHRDSTVEESFTLVEVILVLSTGQGQC